MTAKTLNTLGKQKIPFLFISDFLAQDVRVILLDDLEDEDVEFFIDASYEYESHSFEFVKHPLSFESYKEKFDKVIEHIKDGNTYLLNLTLPTPIESDLTLKEIYNSANAKYKLRYKDEFVCFSPEKFISIQDNRIHTFPMKGTIDSSKEDAKQKILADEKEMAEHTMVVDLLRNDLSIVATDVKVEKFRYVTGIDSGAKKLLQVSSHISAYVGKDWRESIGDILYKLIPAGSISGTPKKSTLQIIQDVENYERGFYSGVFGVFDGESFDSGVMIRFVEKSSKGYIYKSGGGITLDSVARMEYDELLDKIYLP